MAEKTNFNLAKEQAERFGEWVDEAFEIMLDFALEDKFDCYSIEEQNQLERVLEILTIFSSMWENGQIITISKKREEQ
ncbi:hypothetical protein ACQRDX_04860 [Streptococcus sp. SGI.013]|uniref:hypothetical protein n=1 Tax=unclassified Streptococcus TaxID=2608887 RepID=UPI003D090F6E